MHARRAAVCTPLLWLTGSISALAVAQAPALKSEPATAPAGTNTKFYSDPNCTEALPLRDWEAPPGKNYKGKTYSVWVWDDSVSNVQFDEKERQSRFYSDVQSVLGSVIQKAAAKAPRVCKEYKYVLKYERGSLTVTGYDDSKPPKAVNSVVVATGPKEHAFLALDLPVTNTKTLKYDSSSGSLVPQSTNPQLYLSMNLLWGDIVQKPADLPFYQNFSIKAMILASSRPFDSFGIAVGYRFGSFSILGHNLSSFGIFGGSFWTKQDTTSNGKPNLNGATAQNWRFGITYDVGSALKYVHW